LPIALSNHKHKQVVVAADDARIVQACQLHGVTALLTRQDHLSGSDRLAEACQLLELEVQTMWWSTCKAMSH
jgi:CMP-2-keto-3-deoxyoctulosonic acid synthetase